MTQAPERKPSPNPPKFFLKSLGQLFEGGEEITHKRSLEYFHQNLKPSQLAKGFEISNEKECVEVAIEDTPYFIRNLSEDFFESQSPQVTTLGGRTFEFLPQSLEYTLPDRLVCKIEVPDSSGSIHQCQARFINPAYNEILNKAQKDSFGSFVWLKGKKFYLNPKQASWKKFFRSIWLTLLWLVAPLTASQKFEEMMSDGKPE